MELLHVPNSQTNNVTTYLQNNNYNNSVFLENLAVVFLGIAY